MFELEDYINWIGEYLDSVNQTKEIRLLKKIPLMELAYKATLIIQPAVLRFTPLARTSVHMGRIVLMGREDLTRSERNLTVSRFKTGYHLLSVLFNKQKIKLTRDESNKKAPYLVKIQDKEWIENLFYIVDSQPPADIPTHVRPAFEAPEPFTEFNHNVTGGLARHMNTDVLERFKPSLMPKVYKSINKHMNNAYRVNKDVLAVYDACIEDDLFTLKDKILTDEQREGMEREIHQTLTIAKGVGGRKFWEYMFYDNRGRLYSSAVYFSHQGSKLSKSLFLFNEKIPIGKMGLYWLFVHAANCWGYDKERIQKRHDWANEKWEEWKVWAEDPVKNKQWQKADDPFNFLAAILELKKANGDPQYESGLPIALDATCSGLQVLSALSRDEKSAALCNLTDTTKRGDYYLMIADEVWKQCLFKGDDLTNYQANLEEIKHDIGVLSVAIKEAKKEDKKDAVEARKKYTVENKDRIDRLSQIFWARHASKRRSLVKRPCMTYFYSCGARTMAKQLYSDYKTNPELIGLQPFMCYWLCIRIYETCRKQMPIATHMMDLAIEFGLNDFKKGLNFEVVGENGFVLMQNYQANIRERICVPYKKRRIKISLIVGKEDHLDYRKIKSSTSPNLVHMLDAQIVSSVLLNAEYTVSCIHDSFSSHAANTEMLYEDTRQCFVDLFPENVIYDLINQNGYLLTTGDTWDGRLGTLDLNEVIQNEYCFS